MARLRRPTLGGWVLIGGLWTYGVEKPGREKSGTESTGRIAVACAFLDGDVGYISPINLMAQFLKPISGRSGKYDRQRELYRCP